MRFLKLQINKDDFEIIDLLKVKYLHIVKMDYNPTNLDREKTWVIRFYFGNTFCSYSAESKQEVDEIIKIYEEVNENANTIFNKTN